MAWRIGEIKSNAVRCVDLRSGKWKSHDLRRCIIMIYLPLVWYMEHFGPEPILQRRRRLKVASTDSSWWLQASCPTRTCCNQAADNDDILLVFPESHPLSSPEFTHLVSSPKAKLRRSSAVCFVGLLLPETSPTIAYNQWLVNIEYCGCTQQCFCSLFIRVSHTKTHRTPQHSVRIDFQLILRPCSFLTVSVYLCWCWCRSMPSTKIIMKIMNLALCRMDVFYHSSVVLIHVWSPSDELHLFLELSALNLTKGLQKRIRRIRVEEGPFAI